MFNMSNSYKSPRVKTFILHLPLRVLEEEEEKRENGHSTVELPVTAAADVPTFGQFVA